MLSNPNLLHQIENYGDILSRIDHLLVYVCVVPDLVLVPTSDLLGNFRIVYYEGELTVVAAGRKTKYR